ncbi:hypothetical protein PCL_11336 [Purpureocillium lilacinum]|uniref:Zn(2)-C6 fungal-type domain-containing protein n=1 Tax=Purpureocillium lilacinum TaxID=33203 RepID=A0A2U3DPT3_PURLI|nr:hypothetical protein PCL_11336 [Purpureocillium lilacinum]
MSTPQTSEKHAANCKRSTGAARIRCHGNIVQPYLASTIALIGKVLRQDAMGEVLQHVQDALLRFLIELTTFLVSSLRQSLPDFISRLLGLKSSRQCFDLGSIFIIAHHVIFGGYVLQSLKPTGTFRRREPRESIFCIGTQIIVPENMRNCKSSRVILEVADLKVERVPAVARTISLVPYPCVVISRAIRMTTLVIPSTFRRNILHPSHVPFHHWKTTNPCPPRLNFQVPAGAMSVNTASASQQRYARVLACAHCQQRKVKCDRQEPCSNCVKVCRSRFGTNTQHETKTAAENTSKAINDIRDELKTANRMTQQTITAIQDSANVALATGATAKEAMEGGKATYKMVKDMKPSATPGQGNVAHIYASIVARGGLARSMHNPVNHRPSFVQAQREIIVNIRDPVTIINIRAMSPRSLGAHVDRAIEQSNNEHINKIRVTSSNQLKSDSIE